MAYGKWHQGKYRVINRDKYVGDGVMSGDIEECFLEPNSVGMRLFKPGKHSTRLIKQLLKSELVELICVEYNCIPSAALIGLFNGGFLRCSTCAKPISGNLSSASCSIKCGRQMSLKHLRETGKIESVREKCRAISTKWWAEMDSEMKGWIIGRLHAGQKEFLESISVEERKPIFNGKPNGFYESLKEYYEKLPIEDFLAMRREIGKGMRKTSDSDILKRNEYSVYVKEVWRITETSYKDNISLINPDNLPRGHKEYHLDHKYSMAQGFIEKLPPDVIGSFHNLQILWYKDNISKGADCSISKEALLESFNGGV